MIIAEIGTSHSGSIEKAKALIDGAAAAGADTVKFQWVYAGEILHPKTGFVDLPTGRIPLYERFRQLECPREFYAATLEYAHSKKLKWVCSPFGLGSLNELLSIKPDAVKIASPELNHFPLLRALAGYRSEQARRGENAVPVIVSSGVSKMRDIEAALEILCPAAGNAPGKKDGGITLLHCITSYPAPEDEYNVRLVSTLKDVFGIETGLSDHSLDPVLVPVLSVAMGGTVLEKHITLSKSTDGLDDPVALTVEQFSQMTCAIGQAQAVMRHYGEVRGRDEIIRQMGAQYGKERVARVLGSGVKALAPAEEKNYGRTNRSLHYMGDFAAGHVISGNDVGILRTEKILTPGLSPEFFERIIGARLSRPVSDGAGVEWGDFLN